MLECWLLSCVACVLLDDAMNTRKYLISIARAGFGYWQARTLTANKRLDSLVSGNSIVLKHWRTPFGGGINKTRTHSCCPNARRSHTAHISFDLWLWFAAAHGGKKTNMSNGIINAVTHMWRRNCWLEAHAIGSIIDIHRVEYIPIGTEWINKLRNLHWNAAGMLCWFSIRCKGRVSELISEPIICFHTLMNFKHYHIITYDYDISLDTE